MQKSSQLQTHARISAGFPASGIGRKLIPSLALVLGLPCSMTASADTDIFNTAGTTNWVCPPGVISIKVECWGGGGAAGGSFIDTGAGGSANAGGGGGGGGAYARLDSVPVTPGNSYVVTIPAAATCPTSGFANNARYDGAAVSFTGDDAVTVTASGGQGGQCRIVTTSAASTGSVGTGAAAGIGYDAAWSGGTSTNWSAGNGSGGGGGAGDLGNGGGAAAANGSSGAGGSGSDVDHTGGNGGGAKNGAGTGVDGSSPGGGGGGSKSTTTSTTSRRGGNGGLGRIILTYTIPPPPAKTKANNTDDLNQGISWVGGAAPTPADLAKWDSIVESANTTALGADLTWSGIAITNPTGLVTIDPGNTLTLGSAVIDIDLSTATNGLNNLVLNCGLSLDNNNTWDVSTGRTLTVGGAVSGNFPLTIQGAGTVRLGASDRLPNGSGNGNITVDGTLDLNGHSDTINGLSGAASGIVDNAANGTSSTLTVGENDQSSTFGGILQNSGVSATLNLIKTGTGTLVLNGQNTLGGTVSITEGTLGLNGANAMDNVTGITMADGTMLQPQLTGTTVVPPIALGAAATTSTITAPLLPPNNTDASTPKTIDVEGAISGDGNLTLLGINPYNQYGTINLNAAINYTGSTLITCTDQYAPVGNEGNQNIFVKLFVADSLPVTTVVTLDGGNGTGGGRWCELDLNGNSQTIAGLQNTPPLSGIRFQQVTNRNTTNAATLTVNNSQPFTFTGRIGAPTQTGLTTNGNNLGLTKSGAGAFTLAGANTYTGATTVTGGTLALGSSTALSAASAVSIGTATLGVGAGVSAATTGTLDCTGAATINLGDGTSTIAFADSGAVTWAGTLNISGTFVSGLSLKFGDDAVGGLSAGQLATQITAAGFTNFSINGSGFLTADEVGGSGFSAWQTANSTLGGLDDDHDGDGVTNGVEFFIYGPVANSGFTALPPVVNAAGTLSVTFTKAAGYDGDYGTDFVVETSATLADPWVPQIADPDPGFTVTFPSPTEVKYTFPAGTKNFARLKVTGP